MNLIVTTIHFLPPLWNLVGCKLTDEISYLASADHLLRDLPLYGLVFTEVGLKEAFQICYQFSFELVSCPAGNNLRKIRLVTLCAFLGLLHTSAGFERGRRWPYMDVLTSTWLQLSPISIHTSARAPVGRCSNWTCYNLIGTFKKPQNRAQRYQTDFP